MWGKVWTVSFRHTDATDSSVQIVSWLARTVVRCGLFTTANQLVGYQYSCHHPFCGQVFLSSRLQLSSLLILVLILVETLAYHFATSAGADTAEIMEKIIRCSVYAMHLVSH